MTTFADFKASKIGIVSRDLEIKDFSPYLKDILQLLDNEGCDTVLFSLYSIDIRNGNPIDNFPKVKHLKMIALEICNYIGTKRKEIKHCSVFIRKKNTWTEHEIQQSFGRVNWAVENTTAEDRVGTRVVDDFVNNELPNRIFGNVCILLCGEINAAKYSKKTKKIDDVMGIRNAIKKTGTEVILNPGHDRMRRHEMTIKRKYLSLDKMLMVSVWNKGGGKALGKNPAWEVCRSCRTITVESIAGPQQCTDIEIGIVELPRRN